MDNIVEVGLKITLTDEDIDDIMCSALEGGITYWCNKAEVAGGKYLGEYAHEQISRGGELILHDYEAEEKYTLSKEKFIKGFGEFINAGYFGAIEPEIKNFRRTGRMLIDGCNIDGDMADSIVQYALFDEIVYG